VAVTVTLTKAQIAPALSINTDGTDYTDLQR